MSDEYPKIETLWDRDPATFGVIPGQWRLPEFRLIDKWLVTEKIDGTNVRIRYCPSDPALPIQYHGRTDAAQMPTFMLTKLQELFTPATLAAAFPNLEQSGTVWLYGEGYGPKIQRAGGNYRSNGVSFRLFDVRVVDWWLNWQSIEDVAAKLNIQTVPVLGTLATLSDALDWVRAVSRVALNESDKMPEVTMQEGIVCRTEPLLFTRQGARVMWKLKGIDFKAAK